LLISVYDGRLRFIFSSSSALLISGATSGGRKDRRTYIENLAAQAEEASNMRNMKDLYDTTKNLVGNFRQTRKQIKNKNGKVRITTRNS
jgi:hypothetical protein